MFECERLTLKEAIKSMDEIHRESMEERPRDFSLLEKAILIRKCYKNWPAALFSYLIGRRAFVNRVTDTYVIRKGDIVLRVVDAIFFPIFELAVFLDNNWSIDSFKDGVIQIRSEGGLLFHCRTDRGNDLGHLVEIFIGQTYGRLFPGETVIDVGMSNADSAIFFVQRGARKVIGLEPSTDSYELALTNIKANHLEDKIVPLNCALADKGGSEGFKVATKSPNINALATIVHGMTTYDQAYMVETISLEDILDKYGIGELDLLKLDCEGCEYRVLERTSPDTLRRIRRIIMEYHNGPQKLASILTINGFQVSYERNRLRGMLTASHRQLM